MILAGPARAKAQFRSIDPDLVSGVILGSRAPEALIEKALELRARRPDFRVEQVSAAADGYGLTSRRVEDGSRRMTGFL